MTKVFQMDFSDSQYVKTTIFLMTTSFLVYVIAYRFLRKKVGISPDYEIRLLTFFHGLFCSICSLHYVIFPALGLYQVNSIPFTLILSHSFGYFLLDLFWCFIHGETGIMKFHHIVTVTGLIYYSFKQSQQYAIVYALGLTEFTNPLLQIRWYMKYHGMREGLAFKFVEGIFIICFFYLRCFVFTYYTYLSWTVEKYNFTADDLFFINLGLFVGYCMAYQMVGYILYQFRKGKTKKEDKYE